MASTTREELESKIKDLEDKILDLREQVKVRHEGDLLEHLNEPRSFSQLMTSTGQSDYNSLIHQLLLLEKTGKVERLDLPRWVRSDVSERQKGKALFSETPLRQRDLELLLARREGRLRDPDLDRPPASTRVTELQQEGLVRLGEKQGDPWFLPPDASAPTRGARSRQRQSHHGPTSVARPRPRSRTRKAGT